MECCDPRALCLRPGAQPRPAPCRAREQKPQRLPPRLRPHHPFDRLPPPQAQDPGVRLRRGRPLPHAAHPHARSDAGGPRARPPAAARRRSRRGAGAGPRSRPSAVRPCRRARARRLPRRVRRLRPQRADPAHRHRAGAPLSGLRRPEPDLGNARRPGQAQRAADRPRRRAARPLSRRTACRRRSSTIRGCRICNCGASPASRRRSPPFADDIAYDAHDIDDGLRAELFHIDDIAAVPLPGEIIGDIRAAYPDLDDHRLVHELIRRADRPPHRRRRRRDRAPARQAQARARPTRCAGAQLAGRGLLRRDAGRRMRAIKAFLKPHMYRHPRVMRVMDQAAGVVRDLFARYSAHPGDLPAEWQEGLAGLDDAVAGAAHRRFHRRHDRPLCARRARPAL